MQNYDIRLFTLFLRIITALCIHRKNSIFGFNMTVILYLFPAEPNLISLLPWSYNKRQARVIKIPPYLLNNPNKSMDIVAAEVIAALQIVNFLPSEIRTKLQVTLTPHVVW